MNNKNMLKNITSLEKSILTTGTKTCQVVSMVVSESVLFSEAQLDVSTSFLLSHRAEGKGFSKRCGNENVLRLQIANYKTCFFTDDQITSQTNFNFDDNRLFS